MVKFRNLPLFQQIANNPEALKAMSTFTDAVRESGVELPLTTPSKREIMQLALNTKFRNALQTYITEMKNAGIDMTSKENIQEIMNAQKGGSKPDS